jgi:hypothetical protein
LIILFSTKEVSAQEKTVGVIDIRAEAAEGFLLLAPVSSSNSYLIDNCGRVINQWTQSDFTPGNSVYLTDEGSLLKTCHVTNPKINLGGLGGRLEKWSWNDSLLWEFDYSTDQYAQHHDIELLPNGNILILALERKIGLDLFAVGRNPDLVSDNEVWSEYIVEIEPLGKDSARIVWEWHAWDHLVQDFDSLAPNFDLPQNHPELIDVNFTSGGKQKDWLHANSLDYDLATDQIMISILNWNEFWIIDHSTSTMEAAGSSGGLRNKGGDLLYRWGNPMTYARGDSSDQKLYSLHDANWITSPGPDSGKIILYNNGLGRRYSSVEILSPPQSSPGDYTSEDGEKYGPQSPEWIYAGDSTDRFFSKNMSGVKYQLNGNILICQSVGGLIFEVTKEGDKVWSYINPVTQNGPLTQGAIVNPSSNVVFKIERYPSAFPGFAGKDLTPGDPIELNFNLTTCLEILERFDTLNCDIDSVFIMPINSPLCLTIGPQLLTAIPEGGIFTGSGVKGNDFDPESAGEGVHTIYYTYQLNNCEIRDSIAIDVQVCTSTADASLSNIKIYPNPNSGDFTIENLPSGFNYKITNIFGQTVFKGTTSFTGKKIDLQNMAAGTYYLSVEKSGSPNIKKIIVF